MKNNLFISYPHLMKQELKECEYCYEMVTDLSITDVGANGYLICDKCLKQEARGLSNEKSR
jgi:formylmethanofuran dehydrogenase subunit E|tara:strand:+ start:193 stop:375 length:183 start_codon:yes stop_codon:yes gene_type:complete